MSFEEISGKTGRRLLNDSSIVSPAFIFDECTLVSVLKATSLLRTQSECQILFSMKALGLVDALNAMKSSIDGIAVSSEFEAKLARSVLAEKGSVHITTPGLRKEDIECITECCDYLAYNSLSQAERFGGLITGATSCGLRVNPQMSFAEDPLYDPCRKHSKLGVPIVPLVEAIQESWNRFEGIRGLHLHSNCDSDDFNELFCTVRSLDEKLGPLLDHVEWVNLGGGYTISEENVAEPLIESIHLLKSKYSVEVFIEPGAALVRKAGFLLGSVVDLFESDGETVAVLDTTVNHWPEVFEYQFEPDVLGHVEDGRYEYIIAGCSCLAGDIFGTYSFNDPLQIGSRLVFLNAGAYSLVKAHMFNGINLPTIYIFTESGQLLLKKRFNYEDFANRWGVNSNVYV